MVVEIRRVVTSGRCGARGDRALGCPYSLMREMEPVWKGSKVGT